MGVDLSLLDGLKRTRGLLMEDPCLIDVARERLCQGDQAPHNFLEGLSEEEHKFCKNHVRNNHMPFDMRCRTCVVSTGTGRVHCRVRAPSAYCLTLDVGGSFMRNGEDPDHPEHRHASTGAHRPPRRTKVADADTKDVNADTEDMNARARSDAPAWTPSKVRSAASAWTSSRARSTASVSTSSRARSGNNGEDILKGAIDGKGADTGKNADGTAGHHLGSHEVGQEADSLLHDFRELFKGL